MPEYIDREKARATVCSLCRWEGTDNCSECEHPIDDIPAADVRPVVRGRWEIKGEFANCTVCKEDLRIECGIELFDEMPHFCPNCGADMREDRKE